jgi:signal transduction histidine kinase
MNSSNSDSLIEHKQQLLELQELYEAEVEKRRELERALKIKDEFFAFLFHEFKTPLTVINAIIQTMELTCKDELSRKAQGYLTKIRQNVFRQLRLINNLLDYTKTQSGYINIHKRNMDIVYLTRVITESVNLYARMKEIELRFVTSLPEKIIAIDDEKFERIILNLLSNAIKFTPSGKCVNVRLTLNKKKVYIEVEDEGIGIPKENLEMIFDRFGQVDSSLSRNSEGTGIGLTLVKNMVKALGGEIEVKSKEKKGSTFKIILPDETFNELNEKPAEVNIEDNRLIQAVNIEFSDIYNFPQIIQKI